MKLSNFNLDVLSNTIYFSVLDKTNNKYIADLEIWEEEDCYVVSFHSTDNFKHLYKTNIDDRLYDFFFELKRLIITGEINGIDSNKKQVLLLEDEVIANRYAVVNELQRVPRYCGFYFIR